MPLPKNRTLPKFRSEAQEREFWRENDTADHVDWARAERTSFQNLKPSTTTISLRLPAPLLADLKVLANQRDVPYQSLLKMYLADRIRSEMAPVAPASVARSKARSPRRRAQAQRIAE